MKVYIVFTKDFKHFFFTRFPLILLESQVLLFDIALGVRKWNRSFLCNPLVILRSYQLLPDGKDSLNLFFFFQETLHFWRMVLAKDPHRLGQHGGNGRSRYDVIFMHHSLGLRFAWLVAKLFLRSDARFVGQKFCAVTKPAARDPRGTRCCWSFRCGSACPTSTRSTRKASR